MTPKHTPGPWVADAQKTYDGGGSLTRNILINPIVLGRRQNVAIAKIPRIGGEEALANALVMASSPELLSLVTQAIAQFDKYQQRGALTPEGDLKRWLIEARSAVAKATGEITT